jgi:hypothetical protein
MAKRTLEDDSNSNSKRAQLSHASGQGSARTGSNFDPNADAGPGVAARRPTYQRNAAFDPPNHNADHEDTTLSKGVLKKNLKTMVQNAIEAMSTLNPEEQDTLELIQWSGGVSSSLGHYGHYLLASPTTANVDQGASVPQAVPVAPPAPVARGFTFAVPPPTAPAAAAAATATIARSAAASRQHSLSTSMPTRDSAMVESNDAADDATAGDQGDSNEGILRAADGPDWETNCSSGPVKVFHLNDPKKGSSGWKQLGGTGFMHLQQGKGEKTLNKKRIVFRDGSLGAPPLNMVINSSTTFSLEEMTNKEGKKFGMLGFCGVNDQDRGYEKFNAKATTLVARELLTALRSLTA